METGSWTEATRKLVKQNQESQSGTGAPNAYYYDVRLLVHHPTLRVDEISTIFEMKPDYAWNAGEKGKHETMWCHVSRTAGSRRFFQELHDILEWIKSDCESVPRLVASGGRIQLIAQLPGSINTGDNLRSETMSLAVSLGITLGVEVFPRLGE